MELYLKETYLSMAKSAEGSKMFQTLWANVDGETKNILDDGDVSCAFFVSSLLKLFDLVDTPHATVSGLEKDLLRNNWKETTSPTSGTIIVWEKQAQANDDPHEHVGIYLEKNKAISNSYKKRVPIIHDIDETKRKIKAFYTHSFLI
ncbi:MAG: hypothetical protein ACJKSS_00600 [Patescibacteria group bacterium UBA2103]